MATPPASSFVVIGRSECARSTEAWSGYLASRPRSTYTCAHTPGHPADHVRSSAHHVRSPAPAGLPVQQIYVRHAHRDGSFSSSMSERHHCLSSIAISGHELGPLSDVTRSAHAGTPMPDLTTAAATCKWGRLGGSPFCNPQHRLDCLLVLSRGSMSLFAKKKH
jgi:hypothetical protein